MIEQLGKYRIDSVLGKGAMGVIYKAFDPYIDRVVALKTIRKELFSDAQQAELIGRFKNEAQAAGRLNHPNIVTVYDYGEDPESAFIAMEFVDGTPLNVLMIPEKPTSLVRIREWMTDLLSALEYAHSRGVVHRDIKPANLLITATAQVKISDFGIARIESSTLTQTGSMIGTPSYMSPEQFRGETVDGRSDVFSAGVLLYQLLTGVRPFTGSSPIVMQQILNDMPVPVSSVLPALGTGYDPVLERALAKRPAERYSSAREFLSALITVMQGGNVDPDATALGDDDRTIFVNTARVTQVPAIALAVGANSDVSQTTGTMTPWKLEALPELETVLSRQIGPMAKFLLKQVAVKANGLDELCSLLLPHIPSELGKVQFQQTVALLKKKLGASGTGSGIQATSTLITSIAAASTTERSEIRTPVTFDAAFETAVMLKLTAFIGPIARVVAKRAARQTNDKSQFLQLLAEHIEILPERARFLAEAANV